MGKLGSQLTVMQGLGSLLEVRQGVRVAHRWFMITVSGHSRG